MNGVLRTALGLSVGLHAGALFGWPTTSPVAFDVERAPTSLEIRLLAPRPAPSTPQVVVVPQATEPPSELPLDAMPPPEPAPQSLVTPESHGALSEILPGYLRNPAPVYPWLARQRGDEGTVILRTEVLSTGRCGQLDVLSSSGSSLLDAAALKAVRQWQFKPAKRGMSSVAVWVEIPITFQLISGGS
ncbi:MAG: energy transducer TonB [Candidatus Omnitrophica bacterium]|nr:energy transducer TonB [Candidatus Omnitrophota bacterium]